MIAAIIAAVVLLVSSNATAAPATPTLVQANSAFESGNFPAAIGDYHAILAADGYSAPVLFNLGNAYCQDGQLGPAILSFERARVLSPDDAAITANLQLAREKAGLPTPATGLIDRSVHFFSANTLAWIGSAALAAICIALGTGWLFSKSVPVKPIAGLGVVVLLAVVAAILFRRNEFDRAIVLSAKTPVLIAPADNAASSFTLKPGEPVTIAKQYGRFVLARTADGRAGWVSDAQVGRVYAPAPESASTSRL